MDNFWGSDVGKVALGGAIAIAGQLMVFLLSWGKEHIVAWRKSELEAQHLGIQLVYVFEKLAGDCYSAVNDHTFTDQSGRTFNAVDNPELTLPPNGDYRVLPTAIMYDVMSIPSRLEAIREGLAAMHEFASPPDYSEYYEYRRETLSRLGLKALELVDALCNKYKFPRPERIEHYDPKEVFLHYVRKSAEVPI
ncbi:hypothetical protein [Pseudomonas fluorescens]|nr:hypothetical protein [Pseudomonas fluorescens]